MPLSKRFWIATADTLLLENVRYVAHCSEVQHSLSSAAVESLFLIGRDILRTNWLGEPRCQRPTFRSGCSWRGTTITLRQWRSHNEWICYDIRTEKLNWWRVIIKNSFVVTTILSCYTLLESCSYKLQHIKISALSVYFKGFVAKKNKPKPKIKIKLVVSSYR